MADQSGEQAKLIVQQAMSLFNASIQASQMNTAQAIQEVKLDLSVARDRANPLVISFPFKSLYVEDASDLNCFVRAIPESSDSGQGDVKLSLKDSITHEFGIRKLYLYWPAQSGKLMVLKVFTQAKVSSGQLLLNQNSIPSTMIFGGMASAPNDGFTVIAYGQLGSTVTGGLTRILNGSKGINISSFNTASFNITDIASSRARMFVVPEGYEAEILAIKATAFNTLSWVAPREVYVMALPVKQTWASEFDFISLSFPNQKIASFFQSQVNGVYYYQPVVVTNPSENHDGRSKVILKAGQMLNAHVNGSWTTGLLEIEFFIRLSRVVGA